MSSSAVMSVQAIPMDESSQKVIIFDVKLKMGHESSKVLMNQDMVCDLCLSKQTFSGTEAGYKGHTAEIPRR